MRKSVDGTQTISINAAPFVIHVFINLFTHMKPFFFKTQVTKETEKLETRIEIEENKSNSIKQVTVSNEYLHRFHSVFPVSKKVKRLLLCIRVKNET